MVALSGVKNHTPYVENELLWETEVAKLLA